MSWRNFYSYPVIDHHISSHVPGHSVTYTTSYNTFDQKEHQFDMSMKSVLIETFLKRDVESIGRNIVSFPISMIPVVVLIFISNWIGLISEPYKMFSLIDNDISTNAILIPLWLFGLLFWFQGNVLARLKELMQEQALDERRAYGQSVKNVVMRYESILFSLPTF